MPVNANVLSSAMVAPVSSHRHAAKFPSSARIIRPNNMISRVVRGRADEGSPQANASTNNALATARTRAVHRHTFARVTYATFAGRPRIISRTLAAVLGLTNRNTR
jgi:hypothetical protein